MTLVRQIGGRVLPFGSKYGGLAELAFYIPSNIIPGGRSIGEYGPRSPLRVEIWRPSPIFALRLTYGIGIEISHPLDLGYQFRLTCSGSSLTEGKYGAASPLRVEIWRPLPSARSSPQSLPAHHPC